MRKPMLLFAAAVASACLGIVAVAGSKTFTTKGAWSFWSAPTLHPPKIHTDRRTVTSKLAPGFFMLANSKDLAFSQPLVGQGGPLILDSHLQPVWFDPVPLTVSKQGKTEVASGAVFNLRRQTYRGQPVLSWWQGTVTGTGATLAGQDVVVNQHYQQVASLAAQGPTGCKGSACWVLSEHEFLIQGADAWVTAYRNVPMDLTKHGGPKNGTVIDAAVQEYDLASGKQLYSWDALAHIPLSESHTKPLSTGVWDAYHENSIGLGNGTFLVSMRNEWTAYEVSESTNKVLWTIGGDPKLSSFRIPSGARFQWQHDVELHPGGLLSVFDDHCCNIVGAGLVTRPSAPSRGLLLKLDFKHHTATLIDRYIRGTSFFVPFLGNTQLLRGSNVVVGWGTGPNFSEFTKSGTLLLDAVIPDPDESYRAYLQSWVGLPLYAPSGAVRKSGRTTFVYASWNGATRVVAWRVLAGASTSHLTVVAKHASRGFETAIPVSGSHKFFEVEALAAHGHVLGTSKPFSLA